MLLENGFNYLSTWILCQWQLRTGKGTARAFEGKYNVITPDLPLHPYDALSYILKLCEVHKPIHQLWHNLKDLSER